MLAVKVKITDTTKPRWIMVEGRTGATCSSFGCQHGDLTDRRGVTVSSSEGTDVDNLLYYKSFFALGLMLELKNNHVMGQLINIALLNEFITAYK